MVARTFFIDASPEQTEVYRLLLEAHSELIDELRPGAVIGDVVANIRKKIIDKKPSLEQCLPRTFGFGIGLLRRENSLLLSIKNKAVVKPNTAFCVISSLSNIPLTDAKESSAAAKLDKYSVVLADTISISSEGPFNLTNRFLSEVDKVMFDLEGSDNEEEGEQSGDEDAEIAASAAATADGGVSTDMVRLQLC